jgi:hypothetical protein
VSDAHVNGKSTRISKHPELKVETRIQLYSAFSEIRTLITSIELEEAKNPERTTTKVPFPLAEVSCMRSRFNRVNKDLHRYEAVCVTKNASLQYTLFEIYLEFTALDPKFLKDHKISKENVPHRDEPKPPQDQVDFRYYEEKPD